MPHRPRRLPRVTVPGGFNDAEAARLLAALCELEAGKGRVNAAIHQLKWTADGPGHAERQGRHYASRR